MNIHITENIDNIIDGYQMIPIIYGKIDTGMLSNNSAENIIAIDAIDSIPHDMLDTFFKEVRSKMRFGCNIILGGIELVAISRDVINGKIDSKTFNELVYKKRGIYHINDIKNILHKHGLVIKSIIIKGYEYEITAFRPLKTN